MIPLLKKEEKGPWISENDVWEVTPMLDTEGNLLCKINLTPERDAVISGIGDSTVAAAAMMAENIVTEIERLNCLRRMLIDDFELVSKNGRKL